MSGRWRPLYGRNAVDDSRLDLEGQPHRRLQSNQSECAVALCEEQTKTAGPTPRRFIPRNGLSFPRLTAFFNSAPALNLATRRAAILIVAPVCGFRPLRALRCEVEKVPKPIRATRSPFFSALVMLSTLV